LPFRLYSVEENLYDDVEYEGSLHPLIIDGHVYFELLDPIENYFFDSDQSFPNNSKVSDAFPLINFRKPTLDKGVLSWGIEYNSFPFISTRVLESFHLPNITYEGSLKSDYSFEFDFVINQDRSQLDVTTGLETVESSRSQFMDDIGDFELCVPHYTYLVSSMDIHEDFSDVMTRAHDVFEFEMAEKAVCEIDMGGTKKPYTLFNHSDGDKESTLNSVGAAITKKVTDPMENAITPFTGGGLRPFANLVFSLDDTIKDDPILKPATNTRRIVSIETENYPVWSGNAIYHDPSLKTFIGFANQIPGTNIGIFLLSGLMGIIAVLMYYRKYKLQN